METCLKTRFLSKLLLRKYFEIVLQTSGRLAIEFASLTLHTLAFTTALITCRNSLSFKIHSKEILQHHDNHFRACISVKFNKLLKQKLILKLKERPYFYFSCILSLWGSCASWWKARNTCGWNWMKMSDSEYSSDDDEDYIPGKYSCLVIVILFVLVFVTVKALQYYTILTIQLAF